GKYIVSFVDESDSETPYTTQYWDGAPTQGTATIIDATNGGEFTGIDGIMTRDPWPAITASASVSPAAPNGSNGWYNSGNVTVTLSASGGTIVPNTLEYKLGTGNWTTYTSPIVVSTDGTTAITYRAVEDGLQSSAEGT